MWFAWSDGEFAIGAHLTPGSRAGFTLRDRGLKWFAGEINQTGMGRMNRIRWPGPRGQLG